MTNVPNQAKSQLQIEELIPSTMRLNELITLTTNYIIRQLQPNGRFVYLRFWPPEPGTVTQARPAAPDDGKYNVLRHAGAVYALTMARQRLTGQKDAEKQLAELDQAIEQSSNWLVTRLAPVPNLPDCLALWSPEHEVDLIDSELVDLPPERFEVKLGGLGLGLVALTRANQCLHWSKYNSPLTWEALTPEKQRQLSGLAQTILSMQKEDGDFYSILDNLGRPTRLHFDSLYYPGEAVLGLSLLYGLRGDQDLRNNSIRALLALARDRVGTGQWLPDHWALISTTELFRQTYLRQEKLPAEGALIAHAAGIIRFILKEQYLDNDKPGQDDDGAFDEMNAITPASTRLEGLLAGIQVIPDSSLYQPLREQTNAAIHRGMNFVMRNIALATEGEMAGAVPRASRQLLMLSDQEAQENPAIEELNRRIARGNRRQREVRIDYVQHALSALIMYENYLKQNNIY